VRIGGLWHDFGLPGFDEDDGGDQDYQYGYKEADDDGSNGRISHASLGCGIAR